MDKDILPIHMDIPVDIDALPDECLLKIFIGLELVDTLRVSVVNKRFRRICSDQFIWMHRRLMDFHGFFDDVVDGLKEKSIRDRDIYIIFYNHRWLQSGFERQLIFKLNQGDGDIHQFISNYFIDNGKILPSSDNDGAIYFVDVWYENTRLSIQDTKSYFELIILEGTMYWYRTESYIGLIESDDSQNYPSHSHYRMTPMYLILITLIYLSSLYRTGKSINFNNILDINQVPFSRIENNNGNSDGEDEQEKDNAIYGISIIFSSTIPDVCSLETVFKMGLGDHHFIQLLHAYTMINRKFGICFDSQAEVLDQICFQDANDIDVWRGEKLIDADFWAYKVGNTMLYMPPAKTIIKIIPYAIKDKLSHPRLSNYSPDNYASGLKSREKVKEEGMGAIWQSILFSIANASNMGYSTIARNLLKFFNPSYSFDDEYPIFEFNGYMSGKFDPYYFLQSPHFVGEFMHPSKLTPNSKVIVLGEI